MARVKAFKETFFYWLLKTIEDLRKHTNKLIFFWKSLRVPDRRICFKITHVFESL